MKFRFASGFVVDSDVEPKNESRRSRLVWKCKNPNCERTFLLLGRISIEKRPPPSFSPDAPTRVLVEKHCCPFCESIEFEEIKEAKS